LDVACGHGNFLYFLQQQGYENIAGIDLDPGRTTTAQRLGLPVRQGDAFECLMQESELSLISALDFVEHVDKEQVLLLFSYCYQALQRGGIIILRAPITDSLLGAHDLHNDITHKWAGNSGIIKDLLAQVGFVNIIFKDERPVPYKVINWIRLGVFIVAKCLTNIWLILLGFSPRNVWSTSGWYIASKP
jgi:SAM-dependent methyltransferase